MISGMFPEEAPDLSLAFWRAWWKEEEIIQEKGKKSLKVTPPYDIVSSLFFVTSLRKTFETYYDF